MATHRRILLVLLLHTFFNLNFLSPAKADDWQPINPAELQMTSLPEAPGVPAVNLYRQVDRDDSTSQETTYIRMKILTEEGRKYGDVEIEFVKGVFNIRNIKARTIRPNGTIAEFDGKIYEKEIIKAKGLKFLAKTFTLPDVQVGSIIEYKYVKSWDAMVYFSNTQWILSSELFTRYAKFSLKPMEGLTIRWSWPIGLPPGTEAPKFDRSMVRMESKNIPAFLVEDYMPPENEVKFRVDFTYTGDNEEKVPEKYWKKEAKKFGSEVDDFTNKKKAMEQAVATIVAAGDSPETKAEKIYTRVQQIRNLSYEAEKTEQEEKRAKKKEISNVEDAWKRGYADGREITWLYLAMVRAAGIEAYPVLISRRNDYFFNAQFLNSRELNDNVVLLKLNGKDVYCDPGSAFTPYGMLPWAETGVVGLKLEKDGGSWVKTTVPDSAESKVEHKASLKLSDDGTLEGKLTVTYSGLDALYRRVEERNEDDADKKKYLEDEVKEFIPVGAEVELKNSPDWKSSSRTMVVEYDLKVEGWASGAGKRVLLPLGLFSAPEKHLFEHANRVHMIYFHYPSQKLDDVTIEPPLAWTVDSVPTPHTDNGGKVVSFNLKVENNKGTLHINRQLSMDMLLIEAKYYPALRSFFQSVKTADEQQVVFKPTGLSAVN